MHRSRINTAQWTSFWKRYNIAIQKKDKFLKKFSPNRFSNKLKKAQIKDIDIQYALKKFNNLAKDFDILQFYRLSSFFLFNPSAVSRYFGASTITSAYRKIVRIFVNKNINQIRSIFNEIDIIQSWEDRPRGFLYEGKLINKINLNSINARDFTRHLSNLQGKYITKQSFKSDKSFIIPFVRVQKIRRGDRRILKVVAIKRKRNRIQALIPSDSNREKQIIKSVLSSKIGSFLDIPETAGNFSSILKFITVKGGSSNNFVLAGIKFYMNNYEISAYPSFAKKFNISIQSFIDKFKNELSAESILELFMRHKELEGKDSFIVRIKSFRHGNLLGSVYLDLIESKLDDEHVGKISKDFESDFGLRLKTYIAHGKYSDLEICKIFLECLTNARREIDVRLPEAWAIYNRIREYGLIARQVKLKEKKAYCFDPHCRLQYVTQWNRKTCSNCGSFLYPGKTITTTNIAEKQITNFFKKILGSQKIDYSNFYKSVLKRKYILNQVIINSDYISLLPLSRILTNNELEILSYRFPNLIIIDTKGKANEIQNNYSIISKSLHDIFHKIICVNDRNYFKTLAQEVQRNKIGRLRNLALNSMGRITNNKFYVDKNKIQKNYGAELFEADCSAMLNYIFTKSIWLGVRKRGKEVPDGISAFPLIYNQKGGCFIWDAKFSESGKPTLGGLKKNRRYVIDASANKSIKKHGGLMSYIIIGNHNPPKNFVTIFKKVAKTRRMFKCNYINASHLLKIFNCYRQHEIEINANDKIRNAFLEFFRSLFFKEIGKKTVAEIIDNKKLDLLLQRVEKRIRSLQQALSYNKNRVLKEKKVQRLFRNG